MPERLSDTQRALAEKFREPVSPGDPLGDLMDKAARRVDYMNNGWWGRVMSQGREAQRWLTRRGYGGIYNFAIPAYVVAHHIQDTYPEMAEALSEPWRNILDATEKIKQGGSVSIEQGRQTRGVMVYG
jgi:hypothetical protein